MNELTPLERKVRGTKARKSRAKVAQSRSGRPSMPSNLTVAARRIWRQTIKLLEDRQTLTPGDGPAIAIYAETTARYREAVASLTANGLMQTVQVLDSNGQAIKREKLNPALKVVETCERIIQVYLKSLGLTALTRERVRPLPEKRQDEDGESPALKAFREEEARQERRKPLRVN